jgi:hypothetical protein
MADHDRQPTLIDASLSWRLVAGRPAVWPLSACAIHWPWKHKPKPAPQPVHYVTVVPDAAPISEYWDRNTLQFDLTALSGEGSATLSQIKSVGWPVRLEFLVRPGSFGQLEVVGAQRVVYEVPTQGAANLIFKLASGVYPADTQKHHASMERG